MTGISSPESSSVVVRTEMPSSLMVFLAEGDSARIDALRKQANEAREDRRKSLVMGGLRVGHSPGR